MVYCVVIVLTLLRSQCVFFPSQCLHPLWDGSWREPAAPLCSGILELCAPSSSPTPLPIISPISEQGIVFNLHTWNEKSVGNYIYHIPWWKWKDKWQIGRCRVRGRCNNIWTHLGCTEIKALLWSETLLKDSSDNLSKTVLAKESRKWGIFYEKVQIQIHKYWMIENSKNNAAINSANFTRWKWPTGSQTVNSLKQQK